MTLAAACDAFESAAARFVVAAREELPDELKLLAFSSPLSARTPDVEYVWHRGLRARDPRAVLALQHAAYRAQIRRVPARAGFAPRRFGWKLYGEPGENLLVCSALVGRENDDGAWETAYVPAAARDAVLAFGYADALPADCTRVPHLPPARKLAIARALLRAGRHGLAASGVAGVEAEMLALVWRQWAAGMLWLHDFYLGGVIAEVLAKTSPRSVGCVHEMHAYSRIVWDAAARVGARTCALQHAGVAWGKRWYFPHADELAAGLRVPDVMHVYSEHAEGLLRVGLPATEFRYGGSSRFAGWRDAEPLPASRDGHALFVGAMAGFDNEVLVDAAVRVASSHGSPRVRVRLHPHALVPRGTSERLEVAARSGALEVSGGASLMDDIAAATVLVGMGTTVLEEALLLGRHVVHLTHSDYVEYLDIDGLAGVRATPADHLVPSDLAGAFDAAPELAVVRDRLGLDRPLVDYTGLFADGSVQRGVA